MLYAGYHWMTARGEEEKVEKAKDTIQRAIVGIIINYVKKDDVAGTWLESHFRWQIRTFWFGLLWAAIGAATAVILIGFAILFANFCWIIYRIVKGWLNLNDNKPMTFN